MQKNISKVIAITLLIIVIALPIMFIIGIYSVGLLYFGITYEKTSDFVLFISISVVLGGIADYLFNTLVQVCFDFKRINKKQMTFFKIILDFSASVFSLLVVDYFMNSLNIPVKSVFLFSLFITGISYLISNDKEDEDREDGEVDLALRNEIQSLLSKNDIADTVKILRHEYPELTMNQIKKSVQQISKED